MIATKPPVRKPEIGRSDFALQGIWMRYTSAWQAISLHNKIGYLHRLSYGLSGLGSPLLEISYVFEVIVWRPVI